MDESSNVPELRSNPLMLALMCILYRGEGSLPRNRPAVYERCATLLFETWDASRRIHVDLRAATSVEQMLRHLAYWLLTRSDTEPSVTEAELVEQVTAYLQGRRFDHPDEAASAAREFVAFCRGRAWVFTEVGSDAQGDALFTFTHRTFMEYFAAAYLASTSDTPEELCHKLLGRIVREEWDVVAQLAVQIKSRTTQDGGGRFVSEVLKSEDSKNSSVLKFLGRLVRVVDVAPQTLRDLTDRCFEPLLRDPENPGWGLHRGRRPR